MRKLLAVLLAIIALVSCFSIAYAEEEPIVYTSGDYEYILLDDGTVEIYGYSGKVETLAIPSELDGYRVTSIGDRAFAACKSLTEITIPDSLTYVGVNPFAYCTKLSRIYVSPKHSTLATIDGVLFDKTEKKLVCYPCAFAEKTYKIPNGIISIGISAFGDCDFLTEITIPDSVISIDVCAFEDCDSLTEITIPDSVASIGDWAFNHCDSLTEITIPDSVTSIGDYTFSSCVSLTEITIPDSVTSIGDWAFWGCESLAEISIPDSVTHVGVNPFSYCGKLRKINVSPKHSTLATIDGVLFDKTEKKLVCYPCSFTEKTHIIPNVIISIGEWAFYGCDFLTEITIPDSVISIGDYAFSSCDSLTEITIPDGVTYIGDSAFSYCNSLTLTVERNSYAEKYAEENDILYTYTDALDWLNS